jgi:glycosyltransferase involved in cell wall biosynthesis
MMSASAKKHCLVVTYFAKDQPGFLDFSYRIQSLAKIYQLTVVSSYPLSHEELRVIGVNYVVVNAGIGRIGWLEYLLRSARVIRQLHPSVVILLHSMVAPIALIVGKIPTVTYWNEHPTHIAPEPENFSPIKAISRKAVRKMMFYGASRASLVMPIGEAHQQDLLKHGCSLHRIRMIYMGVDASFSEVALGNELKDENSPLKLIYVGSISIDRGRDVMLEAIAIVKQFGNIAHLTIVGANEAQYQYCHNLVEKLQIMNFVTIHRRIPGNEIPSMLMQADVGLCIWQDLPWYRFNPPTKLFEYLVAGLPVLASNIVTHTQYVKDDFNGMIFEYNSASLADAIQRLWKNRNNLSQLKRQAHQASDVYLWRNIESKFLSVVESVVC